MTRARAFRSLRKSLGVYQLWSGVLGLVAVLDYAPRAGAMLPDSTRTSGLLLWLVASIFLVLLVVAGAVLLSERKAAVPLTMIAQLAQTVMFSAPGAAYIFTGGAFGGLLFQDGKMRLIGGWAVHVTLSWSSNARFVGLNVVPLAIAGLFWFFLRTSPRARRHLRRS